MTGSIAWVAIIIGTATVSWEIFQWLRAWGYAKELKREGVSFTERWADPYYRYRWKCAFYDTFITVIVTAFIQFLQPGVLGGVIGNIVGLGIAIWMRSEDEKDAPR